MTECSDHQAKTCTKCNELKVFSEFSKDNRNKQYGLHPRCKSCVCETNKKWRQNNPEKFKATRKLHYQKNIDKMREQKRKDVIKYKEQKVLYDIEYRKQKKVEIAAYKKQWERERRHEPLFKIRRNLRRRVHHALMGKNKSDNTFKLIGCSPEEFKTHIESLWLEGMSWDNYGPKGWHIDHIKECHTFDLLDPQQQNKCFHYSNQRPLWAKDNLSRPKKLHNRSIHKTHQSHQELNQ